MMATTFQHISDLVGPCIFQILNAYLEIESRPLKMLPLRIVDDCNSWSAIYFDYLFYIDFEASRAEPRAQNALEHLQTELLMQAHLTRETAALSPSLQHDFRKIIALAPRLLEELMKVDPSTGKAEDDGVEDEYQLEDFEVVAAYYMIKVGVSNLMNVWG